jgi:hypothetical protein
MLTNICLMQILIQIIRIQRYKDHIDQRRRGARGGPRGEGVVHPYLLGAAQ